MHYMICLQLDKVHLIANMVIKNKEASPPQICGDLRFTAYIILLLLQPWLLPLDHLQMSPGMDVYFRDG